MSATQAAPLLFRPEYETAQGDEAETSTALMQTMQTICETTFKDSGHAVRSVHAKSHGLLAGEMRVLDGLPPTLAQGVFGHAATYPVVMRLSTNPGDVLDDSVSVPRGLALKIIDVEGDRLPGAEEAVTQDFVMAVGPAFAAANAGAFLGNVKLLAKTTDTPQILKKTLSAVLRGTEHVIEAFGGQSTTIKSLGGYPNSNILGETFYSQVPVMWGPYFGKVCVAPVSPELVALAGTTVPVIGHPNALRDTVNAFFASGGGAWEMRVQLCTDIATMPVEDASVVWPEAASPYVPVARITVGPQTGWSETRARAVDDGLAFSPWQGIVAHRPLGDIMRARRASYEMSRQFRAAHNACPLHEPRVAEALPR